MSTPWSLVFVILVAFGASITEAKQIKNDVAIFVFGDSLYEPGNNNYLNVSIQYKANFPPYGETFFRYPTGRFSDGRVVPDFTAINVGLPLWRPYLEPCAHNFTNGANFASAGAAVLVETNAETLNIRIQLGFFKNVVSVLEQELGVTAVKQLVNEAIFQISMGGIDYVAYYVNDIETDKSEYVAMVIGNLTDVVKEIYEMGGRKFAYQNVGPLGCMPDIKQTYNISRDACVEELMDLALLHNNVFLIAAKELENQLPGFKYSIFDFYNSVLDRMENPRTYGFKVGDSACCGAGVYRGADCGIGEYDLCSNPNDYVLFDGQHPTEKCNSQLAELFWNGPSNITGPLTFKQLYELEPEIETPLIKDKDGFGLFSDE